MASAPSIVIVYSSDPSKEVSIAGNFTDWTPQQLVHNKDIGRYEYTVTPKDQSGKLNFKFIVDGNWVTDQNFASEFDNAGNENNVIIYDYTKEKSPSKERDVSSKKAVESDNKEAPSTPDPTPMNASPTTSTPSTTANQTPTQSIPILITTPTNSEKVVEPESTVASKTLPKTAAPPQSATTEALVETTPTKVLPQDRKQSEVPKPQPVARPSILNPTEAPSITPQPSKSPVPLPSEPAQIPGEFEQSSSRYEASTNASIASIRSNNRVINREDAASAPKDWNFFANLLHLIAEFFKNWFRRGANA